MTNTKSQIEHSWLRDLERKMSELIRLHGCYIQGVIGHGSTPNCAYTVGLTGVDHPELIVFGLDFESAGGMLNWFAERIRAGEALSHGQIVRPPGSDARILVTRFPDPWQLFAANRHYRRGREAPVRAYQLTWDADGAFPWEPGYPYGPRMQPAPKGFVP